MVDVFGGSRFIRETSGKRGLQGDTGPPGKRGPRGLQGLKGDEGEKGDKGERGDNGKDGARGVPGIRGPKGEQGLRGAVGERGLQGIQGLKGGKGDKGDKGEKGKDGRRGVPGIQGPKGDRGPAGDRGPSALSTGIEDMCSWIPDIVLDQFEKNEECCLQVIDPKIDLHMGDGAYISWLSRSKSKKNAEADDAATASKRILHIRDKQNALVFNKCIYWVDDIILMPRTGYTAICLTFKVDGNEDMTIISDVNTMSVTEEPFREISASNKEIRVWGVDTQTSYLSIEHRTKKNEWTTIFVEWSNKEGYFMVNNKEIHGKFTCKGNTGSSVIGASIGARGGVNSRYFNGAISSLDIYIDKQSVPDVLRSLLVSQ